MPNYNHTDPPSVLVRNHFRKYGAAMRPKRERQRYRYQYQPPTHGMGYTYPYQGALYNTMLEAEFYTWWGVKSGMSNWSLCRACRMVCYGQNDRKLHTARYHCGLALYRAFRLLQADKKCLICGKDTEGTRYGVPICSEPCCDEWKYNEHHKSREILEEALRLSGWIDPTERVRA